MRVILATLGIAAALASQRWQETCGRTEAGSVALQQALKDCATDALVLLVASHPDDRYVLPAVWLRYVHGVRVAVLLATRGGGGQNLIGPETGDGLERIRTLETEAGCSHFGGDVWYLDRPDAGYRRSAEEAFAEWGRESTLRDLARLIRVIRPDCVITTHHSEESHGHDLAIVDLLPEAIALAADGTYATDRPPHKVREFLVGAGGSPSVATVRIDVDRLEPSRGFSLRRLAYEVLRMAHTSPGPPAPIDSVFDSELRLEPRVPLGVPAQVRLPFGLPSLFDEGIWPGSRERAYALDEFLCKRLPRLVVVDQAPIEAVAAVLTELREAVSGLGKVAPGVALDARDRLGRRIKALERLLLLLAQVQLELEVPAGSVAVAGEELVATVRIHTADDQSVALRADGLGGVTVQLEAAGEDGSLARMRNGTRALATIRIPLGDGAETDPMARRFHGDRFEPPVQMRFFVGLTGVEVPVDVVVPVEQRAPVELAIVPRILLLPTARREVQFSVAVTRHSRFSIDGELEVRAPAGYAIADDRRPVVLREVRGDLFGFEVTAPAERKTGVDVFRIRLGATKVALPVHKVDVKTPNGLRIGLLRGRDDTLPNILGAGGLGLEWSDLSDADIAVADLRAFDTIVVDIRALRDRPDARRGFRRLLEFAAGRGRRLVVFYQKDVEFHPAGEGFLGAPYEPFQVGRARITRADAPVKVLKPQHPLLSVPNRILPSDWDGWEQERALYIPATYASQYEEIVEVHDPGQPDERGALLFARTGEGEYVYCALALLRQLKKLHPGSVRMFANLLSPGARP